MASERPSVALALIGVVLALSAAHACGSPAGSQGGAAEGVGGAGGSGGTGGRGGGTDAPPTIHLVTPHAEESVSGEVMVRAEAADDSGIAGVSFEADELPLGEVTAAPFEVSWDTAGLVNGNYRLRAIARDIAGQTTEAVAEVFVVNGTGSDQPPAVRIFYPLEGSRVCGNMDVQVAASDDEAVVQVELFAAGASFATSTTAPHRGRWDTSSTANGPIALEAVATDAAGQSTRHRIEVVVENAGGACDNLPSVVLTSPGPGSTNKSLIALAASASDDVGVVKVQFFVDNGLLEEDASVPYEAGWRTDDFLDGPHVVKVLAYDTAGQTAAGVVEIALDRDDPTVRITEPATGARVLATFDVEVDAADASGIAWVELSVDGRTAGRLLEPPYTFQVTATRSGEQLVLARAADSAGNERVDQVVVDVDAPPQVVITAPAPGEVVSGELRVRADVTDDRVGPYRVTFKLDGALVGIDASSPFDMTVPVCDRASGLAVLEAIASDASNQEASATVAFEIQTDRPRLLGAPGNGTALLSWDTPCGAAAVTGYRLFWDTASPVGPSNNMIDVGLATTFEHSGVSLEETHHYAVAPMVGATQGSLSNEVEVLLACEPGFHDGGGGTVCSPNGACAPEYQLEFDGVCVRTATDETGVCNDGYDNDRDGCQDCADPDCAGACQTILECCTDGVDNDLDGDTDCADNGCRNNPACDEICTDGLDNDFDGLIDCADTFDCSRDPACQEICGDGLDNDADGLIDCSDSDCGVIDGCLCESNAECAFDPFNSRCNIGMGVCDPCRLTIDCPIGDTCSAGYCCSAGACGCASAADCGSGEWCDASTRACSASCTADSQCQEIGPSWFCDSGTGYCCAAGACGCASASDCGSGEWCDASTRTCSASCSADSECQQIGLWWFCDSGTGQCAYFSDCTMFDPSACPVEQGQERSCFPLLDPATDPLAGACIPQSSTPVATGDVCLYASSGNECMDDAVCVSGSQDICTQWCDCQSGFDGQGRCTMGAGCPPGTSCWQLSGSARMGLCL